MSFSISFDKEAVKFLERLPKNISDRVIEKFEQIKENPFRYLEHYEGDYYKLRIGDFRILIDLDFVNKWIIIEVFDIRGRVYKNK